MQNLMQKLNDTRNQRWPQGMAHEAQECKRDCPLETRAVKKL